MGCYTPQCAGTQDVMLPFNREKQYVKQVKDATESVFADIYIALGVSNSCAEHLLLDLATGQQTESEIRGNR